MSVTCEQFKNYVLKKLKEEALRKMFPRMRPKQGQVLVELLPRPNITPAGVLVPDGVNLKDIIGRLPAQEAIVVGLGVWPTTKRGRPIAYEFKRGDCVMVDPVLGTELRAYPVSMRIYDHTQILAKKLTKSAPL